MTFPHVRFRPVPPGNHAGAPVRGPLARDGACAGMRTAGARLSPDRAAGLAAGAYCSAPCACSTSALNVSGSRTARSERTLRSTSMPALFSPLINRP